MKDLYKENTELKIQNTRLLKKCQTLWSNLANARQAIKEYKIKPYPKGENKRYDASYQPTTQIKLL